MLVEELHEILDHFAKETYLAVIKRCNHGMVVVNHSHPFEFGFELEPKALHIVLRERQGVFTWRLDHALIWSCLIFNTNGECCAPSRVMQTLEEKNWLEYIQAVFVKRFDEQLDRMRAIRKKYFCLRYLAASFGFVWAKHQLKVKLFRETKTHAYCLMIQSKRDMTSFML